MFWSLVRLFVILVIYLYEIKGDEDDLVDSMPWYTGNDVNFNTYSGYLNGLSGNLFYMFTESSDDSSFSPRASTSTASMKRKSTSSMKGKSAVY